MLLNHTFNLTATMSLCIIVCTWMQVPSAARRGALKSPGGRVTGSCELPDLGVETGLRSPGRAAIFPYPCLNNNNNNNNGILFYVCGLFVSRYVCSPCTCLVLLEARRGPGVMGAGIWTWIWKSCQCSWPLSHLNSQARIIVKCFNKSMKTKAEVTRT